MIVSEARLVQQVPFNISGACRHLEYALYGLMGLILGCKTDCVIDHSAE